MKKIFVAALTIVSAFSLTASAVEFKGSVIGSWNDRLAESGSSKSSIVNGDLNGVATVSWGDPAYCSKQSSLIFDGAGSDNPAIPPQWSSLNNPFLLGTLNYFNGVQYANTGLDGVDLNLLVSILTPNLGELSNFEFKMGINNTINPNGDTVSFLNIPGPKAFSYNGQNYSFEIAGFSLDNGITMTSQINACEGATKSGAFYGRITQTSAIPVPDYGSTVILLGLAVLGLRMFKAKFV